MRSTFETGLARVREFRFSLLLLALLALAFVPVVIDAPANSPLHGTAFLAVLFLGALAIGTGRVARRIGGTLAVIAAATLLTSIVYGDERFAEARIATLVAFMAFATVHILRDVLRAGSVTWDKISGAICAYLLIGVTWGLAYAWIALHDPTAFTTAAGPVDVLREPAMVYYSFVTLTTLGYGDITPVSHAARTLAWLEAAAGQIYLVVLVARLVALHAASDPTSERA